MSSGKSDVIWNYAATFLKIAASALLLPLILKELDADTVGIWSVFMAFTAFTGMVDFGFNPSFTRNVTYIFSGVKNLRVNGIHSDVNDNEVDWNLLKNLISAMRWIYSRISIVLFVLLAVPGTFYIHFLIRDYAGNHETVYLSWAILVVTNAYSLYSQYYESLLMGKGMVKRSKQIMVYGQTLQLLIAALWLLNGGGLMAVVLAQSVSVIVIRLMYYSSFFHPEIREKLDSIPDSKDKSILKIVTPNAVKVGLTTLGGFMVQKTALFAGSVFLSLSELASFGISLQLVGVISSLSIVYTTTFIPKITAFRVENNLPQIKKIYFRGLGMLMLTYLAGGALLLTLGAPVIEALRSDSHLLAFPLLLAMLVFSLLENNHSLSALIILTRNEVPFFVPSLVAGGLTILFLLGMLQFTSLGVWALILAPGIAQLLYQNWKWPMELMKEFK